MSTLCGHKSVGSPWEQAGEVMLEPEGCCRRLPRSCLLLHSACSALLAVKRLKVLLHPCMRSSPLIIPPTPSGSCCLSFFWEAAAQPSDGAAVPNGATVVSVDSSDHLPPSQPLLRAKPLLMAIASSSSCRWWCSSRMTCCPRQ